MLWWQPVFPSKSRAYDGYTDCFIERRSTVTIGNIKKQIFEILWLLSILIAAKLFHKWNDKLCYVLPNIYEKWYLVIRQLLQTNETVCTAIAVFIIGSRCIKKVDFFQRVYFFVGFYQYFLHDTSSFPLIMGTRFYYVA